jgi:branched-chain amino acid transport system substrate-binding protein
VATAGVLAVAACGSSSKKTTTSGTSAGSTGTTAAANKYSPIPAGPIKLGVITAVSGANAAFGTTTKKAFETVTQQKFNALHPDGIDGHPVQIVVYDDGSDVTKGVNAANQMVSDKLAAVITVSTSPATTDQEMAVFNKAKMPVIAYASGDTYNDAKAWPYFFSTTGSGKQFAQAVADYITKHPEYKKIAVLSDGGQTTTEFQNNIFNPLKTSAPSVSIVKQATISPGAVEVSTQIAQLKDSNPDLLFVNLGFGYGPVWQALQSANWSPKILTSAGAWYDGFSGMGNLANNAIAGYEDCVKPNHAPYPKDLTDLMDAYAGIFGATSTNYLTFVQSDSVAPELAKKAIEKFHSVDPDAIKEALETMGPTTLFGVYQFNITPTNHVAVVGDYGPAVCNMSPLVDGPYRQPTIAS